MRYKRVSNNTVRRLPKYLRKLNELAQNGATRVSSAELGAALGCAPSQVRHDLDNFGTFGMQGYGYDIAELRSHISRILGMDRSYNAILVGCGNIGQSLLCNFNFEEHGVKLEAAFDVNRKLIGQQFNGVSVLDASCLPGYLAQRKIDIAVLSVPKEAALDTAQVIITNGIRAIWNFTNTEVVEPNSTVLVENVHLSDSLLALSYYFAENEDAQRSRQNRMRSRQAT